MIPIWAESIEFREFYTEFRVFWNSKKKANKDCDGSSLSEWPYVRLFFFFEHKEKEQHHQKKTQKYKEQFM